MAFDDTYSVCWPQRDASLAERRFATIPGAQWEGSLADQFQNRPRIEINMAHLAIIRVEDEWRNNRVTATFTSQNGSVDDTLADTCDALFRADELDSTAQEAYDNAVSEAIGGGFGAVRLRACYEDEYALDSDYQRIRFEPITDADSTVFFNIDAKLQDKSDATMCWVLLPMSRDAYVDKYGEIPTAWSDGLPTRQWSFDWVHPDVVYVAEFFKVEDKTETLLIFEDISGGKERLTEAQLTQQTEPVLDDAGNPDDAATLAMGIAQRQAIGTKLVDSKPVKSRRVHKYILGGSEVLEDCGLLPGREIPIIPVYGKRWFVGGIERFMGHTRLSQDSQRLLNMQVSRIAETAGRSSDSKPIFHPEQIIGQESLWANDNLENFPFLLINKMTDANGMPMPGGPVGQTQPTPIAPATAALLQITQHALDQLLGSGQNPEAIMSNVSGKALSFAAQRLDARAYIFLSNAAKMIRRVGQVWLSMAREIYVEPSRTMQGVDGQGGQHAIQLMRPAMSPDGSTTYSNDMTLANCKVSVEVGPTAGSQRQALVDTLVHLLQVTQDPMQQHVIGAMILMNVEGEGMADFHEYQRKRLLTLGIGKPTEQDKADMAQAQQAQQAGTPDPDSVFMLASAGKAQADAVQAQAKSDWYRAQSIEILSGIQNPISQAALASEIGHTFLPPKQVAAPNPATSAASTQPPNPGASRSN